MPNFPLSLDDDASLYLAVNNLRTRLTSSIDASTLTIPVITTSGFPNNGFLTILSDPNDITKAEAIRYEGYTLTTFSGIERGAEGTPALAHNNGDNVDLTVVADHHNELKDAIIEIEKFLGVSGSENFVPFAEGGNVILPADLSVQDNLTVSGAGDFGSLHVNDFLTVSGGATFCFVTITGTLEADNLDVNFDAGVSGTLTVGELATASGTFPDALTVSGIPVHAGDPLNIGSINAYQSMTVSGQPVSTGTIDFQLLDDLYVNESGDSMSGNLDMQGNNVYNAGVVAMQDDAPTVVTSGLLWFDTDAPGISVGSANLPGGFLGAYVTSTSGIDIPDDGSFHAIVWDTEEYDKGGWHDNAVNPHRLTVPSGVTHVQVTAGMRFPVDSTGDRRFAVTLNDDNVGSENQIATTIDDSSTTGGTPYVVTVTSPVVAVSGGDFLAVHIRQTSTSTLTVGSATIQDTFFSIAAVDTRGVPGVNSVNLLQGDINLVPGSGVAISADSNTGSITIDLNTEPPEFSGALVGLSTNTAVANNGAPVVEWDTEHYDTDDYFTTGSGQVFTVPSGLGITHVVLKAQIAWEGDSTPPVGRRQVSFLKNYQITDPLIQQIVQADTEGANEFFTIASYPIPVVEGDELSVLLFQNSGVSLDILGTSSADRCWFSIENVTPTAGGAGSSFDPTEDQTITGAWDFANSVTVSGQPVLFEIPDPLVLSSGIFLESLTISGSPAVPASDRGPFYGIFSMDTSATESIANGTTAAQVTTIDQTKVNTGGFILQPNGVVELPAGQGYTHAKLRGTVSFANNTTGSRHLALNQNGTAFFSNADGTIVGAPFVRQETMSAAGVLSMEVHSPLITVSGGEQFHMAVFQTSGGNLDVVGGGGAEGTLTSIQIEAFKY